jgi:hypothetical protein
MMPMIMTPRLKTLYAAVNVYALLWSVSLLIMLEDDVAALAFMFS